MIHDLERVVPLTEDVDEMIGSVNASILGGAGSPNTLRVMREQVDGVRDPLRVRATLIAFALGSPEFQRQ